MRDRKVRGVLPVVTLAAAMVLCAQGQEPAEPSAPQGAAASGTGGKLTNEQMRHFRRMGNPRLSPDGKHVLLQVWDSTADGGKSHLWLIDVAGGEPRQLTVSAEGDKRGEFGGDWTPDGQSVLFLAHRGQHTSLYRLPLGGGEAKAFDLKVVPAADESKRADAVPPAPAGEKQKPEEKAEPAPVDVEGYRVSPDGTAMAVWARDPETPGEKKQKDAKADASWVDHDTHGSRVYLLNLPEEKGGVKEELKAVAVPADVQHVAWAPDGKRMVVLSDEPNNAGDLQPAVSGWMVQRSDLAHPVQITEVPTTAETLEWTASSDGLLYVAQSRQDAPPGYGDLFRLGLASKTTENLSDRWMGSVGGEPIGLRDGGVLMGAEIGLDGVALRYGPGKREPELLRLPVAETREIVTNAEQNGWVLTGSGSGTATTLYFASALGAEPKVLKTPAAVPDGFVPKVVAKRVKWKNEKLDIQGLLYLPLRAPAAPHTVPLVVEVHGGPTGAYSDSFDPFAEYLVGQGWAVLRTNPRGSRGRGAAFAAANKNDLGGADFRDIMAGVDYVLKTEPALDGSRMALMGYSYGGEMAGFAEGKTARFRAIVSMAPVIDQASEYGTESSSRYDKWFFGRPWERQADAWRQSPLSGVPKAKSPFLLIQGEGDTTDPLGQAQEMYRALRQQRVPVELVTYPRENHGPLATGIYGAPSTEPWHGFDARQRIVTFVENGFAGTR